MLVHGLCFSVMGLIWTHSLQEMVPRDLLGRVSSIDALGSFVLMPIGFAAAGWATELLGAPLVFLIGGFSTMLLAALPLLHPAIRNLD
jgi:DHA3 family tetracycline resistance protein-like MFS transporter